MDSSKANMIGQEVCFDWVDVTKDFLDATEGNDYLISNVI